MTTETQAPDPGPADSVQVTALWQAFGRTQASRDAIKWAQDGEIPGALFVAFRAGLHAQVAGPETATSDAKPLSRNESPLGLTGSNKDQQATPFPAPESAQAEPKAWLRYARKKPELRAVSFNPELTPWERAHGWALVPLAPLAAPAPQAAPCVVDGVLYSRSVVKRLAVQMGLITEPVPAPAEAHGQMLIDNFKAAHLEWLSVDGDAEDGVPYARASEALAAAEAKLLAALEPRVQPKHTQKPCLVTGDCKHGSWCSDVYCQEHCQFVKGTDALDALADLCGLATGGWDLPPSAVVRIGELARKASAALRAPAPGADRPLPAELGEWLTAIGELYIAMGRPPFEATEPTMGVVETLREAAKRVATIEGLQQAVAAGFPVVARWTKNAKDGAPRARVWVQFEDGGPEVEFASGTQAPAVVDGVAWELPTPAVGDYVLATKWSDGDPGDNWALGFYNHSDTLNGGQTRHYVADSAGKNIRGNGFRKVHGPIRGDVGRWLLEVASKTMEASPPGVVNLWTMLTPFAFDLERDREPVSHPPVQGSES